MIMFHYQLFVGFTIILVVLINLVEKVSSDVPERCCTLNQYSSKISLSIDMVSPDGKDYITYSYYNISYDWTRGIFGMKGVSFNVPDEQPVKLWIIETLNDRQIYTIDLDTKKCSKSPLPYKPLNCIPETATYIDSSMYGYDSKQIIGDTWRIQLNETITYSTVSRGDCIPLTEHTFVQKPQMVIGSTITNFLPHIDDPSIFDIPSQCQNLL